MDNSDKNKPNSNSHNEDDYKPALYTPSHIANFFLTQKGHDIDNLKLNKLAYISFGWALTINKVLFNEPIQAWKFGPVVPSLYHEFKRFGYNVIRTESKIYNHLDDCDVIPTIPESDDRETIDLLKNIYDTYGSLSSLDLVDITHHKGTPWHETYYPNGMDERNKNQFNLEINKYLIESYYIRLRKEYKEQIGQK